MKIELLFLTFLIGIFNSSVFAQSKIYATTSQGGAYDGGVLYELTTDGSSFANVYDFVIDKPAINPQYSELTQATDGNLYGVSPLGGENSAGVIFKYDPLTTSYAAVHEFSSASGSKPYGKLTLGSDGLLYGMTSAGGTNNVGVIFTFDFATNTYTKVFDFGTSNGTNPYGYLLEESAGVFYGMTSKGGVNNLGVIFKYDVITSTFTKIIDFKTYTGSQAFLSSGANPFGGFVKATNGLLYALSYAGGLYNLGAIFTFNPATNSMVKLIDLTNSHGTKPYGSFFKASNNKLYALNSGGGLNTQGSLISIDPTTGNTFARLVDFSAANGIAPNGSVLQAANGKLYGTTTMGGTNNLGVVFSYDIAMASVTKEFDFSTATGNLPSSTFIQASDGLLYTITNKGGNNAAGTIVSYNTATSTLNTLVHLNQANTGSYPYSGLVLVGNTTLYGMTPKGGVNGKGTLYSLLTGSNTYTKIIDFNGTNGANPYGSLIKGINGKLYGMTSQGGTNDLGTIFEFNTSTNTLTTLYSFSAANGSYPFGELVEYAAGVFYGMSRSGGTNSKGTLFSYNNNTSVFSKLIDFDGINYGANPYGALLKSLNGKLYGLTYSGGANSKGVLFSFNPTGSVFTKHVDFNGTDGSNPYGTLVETSIGQLYGLTYFGGTTNKGSLFGYNVAAGILTKYVNFNGANGSFPYGSLLVHSNDTLYGMTYSGGTSSKGTVFSYVESETSVTLLKSFAGTDGAYPLYSTAVVAPCVAAAAPASINGLSTVCQMSLGESYSVALVPGIGSYSWVVSDDATIVSGQGTSTITINFGMASPTISVYAISPCDTSIATTLLVTTVPPAAPATPGVITGLSNICSIGTTNTTYSIAAVLNASDYIWSITNGATIIGGQGTTAITVSFPDAAEAFSISVKAANSCDTSAANTLNVTDTILNAGLISGPDYYCSGSGTGTYSITAVANASGYEWSVPTGITITAGQGTTSIDISVDAAFVGGFIKVFAYNGCDSTAFSSKAIGSLTSEPDSIYGDQMVCSAGTSPVTYFINSIVGASSYQWIMPVGATILSGQGDTLITVSFTNMFVNGFIYVYSVSGCGNSDSASLFVSDIPFEIETISGPTSVCSLGTSNVTYTASASTGASSFNWSYPSNVNYVSGQGTSTLVVNFQSSFSSGTLSVQGINGCGFSDTTSLTVYRKPAKVDTIIGPRNVCGYASTTVVTYTASAVAGATAYQWVTGSGITIVSGQGTSTLNVKFAVTFNAANISVYAKNACGNGLSKTASISRRPVPVDTINGNQNICGLAATQTYTCTSVATAVSYSWTVPTNVTLNSGQGTTSINVTFGATFSVGFINVYAINTCGTSNVKQIRVSKAPGIPASISGPINICSYGSTDVSYIVSPVVGATSYLWAAPSNSSISSGQGNDTAKYKFTPFFSSGNVNVKAVNACGTSSGRLLTVYRKPTPPIAISGSTSVCSGDDNKVYSTGQVAGATWYNWTLPTGSSITSGVGSNNITVTFGAISGQVCVNAQNGCGTSIFKCVGVSVSACRLGNFDTNGNNADEPEPNVISVTPIRIYPNPIISGNELVIEWDADIESNPNEIKIFDLTGKCVVNIKNPLNEENRTRITGLTTGIYLIQIHSKSDVYNHKLVVD